MTRFVCVFVFVELQTTNKDGSTGDDGTADERVDSASVVQKLLIESMLKSIHVALRQQSGDQQLSGQYCLHHSVAVRFILLHTCLRGLVV